MTTRRRVTFGVLSLALFALAASSALTVSYVVHSYRDEWWSLATVFFGLVTTCMFLGGSLALFVFSVVPREG